MLAKVAALWWWIVQEGRRRCNKNAVAQGAVQSTWVLKTRRVQRCLFCLCLGPKLPCEERLWGEHSYLYTSKNILMFSVCVGSHPRILGQLLLLSHRRAHTLSKRSYIRSGPLVSILHPRQRTRCFASLQ